MYAIYLFLNKIIEIKVNYIKIGTLKTSFMRDINYTKF